jgi:hypothetical protein
MKIKRRLEEKDQEVYDLFQSIGIDLNEESQNSARELVRLCADLQTADPETVSKLAGLLRLPVTEDMPKQDICKLLIKEKKHRIHNEELWQSKAVYIQKYRALAKEKGWTEARILSKEINIMELIGDDFSEDAATESLALNFPLIPKLEPKFKNALLGYIGVGYEPINGYLRLNRLSDQSETERTILKRSAEETISLLKETIANLQSVEWPRTTNPTTVLRAMSALTGNEKTWSCDCGKKFLFEEYYIRHQKLWSEAKHGENGQTLFNILHQAKPGDRLVDQGFLSTTTYSQMAATWIDSPCCILIIHIPANTPYVNVNFAMNGESKEFEVLFPPNRQFIYLDRFGPFVELQMMG